MQDTWVGKIPWRRECYPLQHSCLESSTDRGDLEVVTVHGVTWGHMDMTEQLTLSFFSLSVEIKSGAVILTLLFFSSHYLWTCPSQIFLILFLLGISAASDTVLHFLFLFLFIKKFFSFIFISWRLITLQYCSGFCHTLTWISHGFTCIPHPDPRIYSCLLSVNSFSPLNSWTASVHSPQLILRGKL